MKLGLISDIHGNLQALERILATLDDNGVEMILCAGDLVCYGADHEQVLRVLRERHIPCVVGNYDYAVAWDQPRASEKSSSLLTEPLKQAALDWTKTHISPESRRYLKDLPMVTAFQIDGLRITVLHATLDRLDQEVHPEQPADLNDMAARLRSHVIVLGHTHRAFSLTVRRTLFINPGAVGRSLDGDLRACGAILDTQTLAVDFLRVNYDVDAAVQAILHSGMPQEIATLVQHGARRLEEVLQHENS